MILKIKHFVLFVTMSLFLSCQHTPYALSRIEGKQFLIDSKLSEVDSLENYVAPYRNRINEVLDSVLAYAPKKITKEDGRYNTTAGNLLADLVLSEANPIFKVRTGKQIDFVLLNHGGIRSIISNGNVTARHAFEVMPFENSIVVAELSGKSVLDLVSFLAKDHKAHPISGIQIVLDQNDRPKTIHIRGKPLDENATYNVATSNYLIMGGDRMYFFKDALRITDTDYLIRNAMIDYFKKADTLSPAIDGRFIKLNSN